MNGFWWLNETMSAPGDSADRPGASALPDGERCRLGLRALLKEYQQLPAPQRSWPEAVTAFRQALEKAAAIQAARQGTYDALIQQPYAEHELRAAEEALTAVQQQMAVSRAQITEMERAAQGWKDERVRRVQSRTEHRQFRPGFLEWLTSLGKAMREWRQRDQASATQVAEAEQGLRSAHGELARLTREVELATHAAAHREERVRRNERECNTIRTELDEAQAALGPQFPDAGWWEDRCRREQAALWTDPEWNRARTELFLAALRLHRAFLEHTPKKMHQNLDAAVDIVVGNAPLDLPEGAALAAWRALFFVVPVVSTTFASFARLFSHLGQEELGWLLIDEAGQATPQNAVGALWRSKRAVVVGDPLQLEPIPPLPLRAEQVIRGDHGVDEQWLSSRTSVQRLADRLTPLGTYLSSADEKIWVGAPLTVHRRCDPPMFGIVNEIAYGGLMIDGTAPAACEGFQKAYPSLPNSKWIDVVSQDSQGHWIPAEGEQLDLILVTLANLEFDMSQVMVITPFRHIAHQVRTRAYSYQGLVAGTIHTAQGKQAEIVILVLGSDPQRDGARQWAARKPNLLNVAVSRAKRRLYVIGARQVWATHRHFDVLARRLPHSPPR